MSGPVTKAAKTRADQLAVDQGLADSRTRAQALILAGLVYAGTQRVGKPGDRLPVDTALTLKGKDHPWVSRGGLKLAKALDHFAIDPAGLTCLDLGASTGGFSDCLLQAGAARVIAVDVGYGQLHPRLRDDPRVVVQERTNARHLDAGALPFAVDLVTVDVSFISASKLLPRLRELVPAAELLILVKPQFEVGREQVGKGGVVRDDALRLEALARVRAAAQALGWVARGEAESRLPGPKGNREIFLWLAPAPAPRGD